MIYVSKAAVITGDIAIGKDSSVWHGAVLRGDLDRSRIGECTSIQDNDRITIIGWCQGDGYRVGFGEVTGRILPVVSIE